MPPARPAPDEDLERRVDERTRALRDAQGELLRKERLLVLGQLSGGLAHQIRTPLTTITNAVAVLRRKLAEAADPEIGELLRILSEEVGEANRIITDLVDFARVRPPTCVLMPVTTLVESALAAARPAHDVEVIRELDAELLICVDERQTRDALANVIRNALEAMGGGGRLTLRAIVAAPHLCITVDDTGPGLSEAAMAHLFDSLVTTKALGLGLGLTIARALIENQGGELRHVARGAGAGARFEIRVPLTRPEPD